MRSSRWGLRSVIHALLGCGLVSVGPAPVWAAATSVSVRQYPIGPDAVIGFRIEHYITDNGIVDVPRDVSSPSFGAWAMDESGFTFHPGVGNPDGTFVISGVPEGAYFLKYGTTYFATDARQLDLSQYIQGRPDVRIGQSGTILGVDFQGLNPWNIDADDAEIFSSNSGIWLFSVPFLDIDHRVPQSGDTQLTVRLDYLVTDHGQLIDACEGDQATIFQLVTQPKTGDLLYAAAAKSFTSSSLTVIDGVQTNFAGTFEDLPLNATYSRTLSYPSIHAYQSDIHPAATFEGDNFFLDILPGGTAHGFYNSAPDLIEAYAYPEISQTETFTFNYGNPFPQWQQPFAIAYADYAVRYRLAGTTSQATIFSILGTYDDAAHFPDPFAVQISPARNFQINGQPASGDLSQISLTPVLTWEPPAQGIATDYQVVIEELYADGTRTRHRRIASVSTTQTSLVLPPDILALGRTYAFRLVAHNGPGTDIETSPFLEAFPLSLAPVYTGILSP